MLTEPHGETDEAVADAASGLDTSTLNVEHDLARDRRGRAFRRIFLGAIAVVVAAGAVGLLGVRTGFETSSAAGAELHVEYPRVTRAGLPVRFAIEVRQPGGFSGPVTVSISQRYLEVFDEQGIRPAPDAETSDGDMLQWEFEPPDGDTLRVTVDLLVETGRHAGRSGQVVLLDTSGAAVASVDLDTWIVP